MRQLIFTKKQLCILIMLLLNYKTCPALAEFIHDRIAGVHCDHRVNKLVP
jgi:hypothetical protein